MIICSFRFGAIRYVPLDLALLGFPTSQIVNQPVYEGMQPAFDSLGPAPGTHLPFLENPLRMLSTCGFSRHSAWKIPVAQLHSWTR